MSRCPKLTDKQKKTARQLRGKKISKVTLNPFDPMREGSFPADEPVLAPRITFTDGSFLEFIVEETEFGEYGVDLIYTP